MVSIKDLILDGKYEGDPVVVSVTRCSCGGWFRSKRVTKAYKANKIILADHSIRIHYGEDGFIIPLDNVIEVRINVKK